MKKIVLLGVTIFTMLNIYAQGDSTIIKMLPKEGQGYLVLNMVLNNNLVDNWTVNIKEKIIDTNNNVTYHLIKKESLYGENYLRIEDTIYNSDKYVLDIKAYDKNRKTIGEIGDVIMMPPNPNPFVLNNTWKCNGLYYAYEIQEWYQNSTGASIFDLMMTGTGFSNDPYFYQYSGNTNDADAWKLYHDVAPTYCYTCANPEAIFINNTNTTTTYYDATGNPISNNGIYGVRKNRGPWINAPYSLLNPDGTTKLFYGGGSYDNYTLNNIIGFYNSYANFQQLDLPELTCQQAIVTLADPNSPEIDYDCLQSIYFIGYTIDDVYELIAAIDECKNGGGGNQVPENDYTAFVINLSDTSSTPIVNIPFNGMVDENGNIIAPSYTTQKGLYYYDVVNKGGQHAYFIKETSNSTVNNLQQKIFLTATAFPVPIIDNTFSLHLQATANVKFTYTLTNLDGVVYYTEDFKLAQGYNRDHRIQMVEGQIIPSGILVNRFEFSDGSVMTFQSIKN